MDGTRRALLVRGMLGLGSLGGLPLPSRAGDGRLQPQLARTAPPGLDPTGFLVSEKLDGVRALWDGRTLRLRSGHPVAAPAWFTAGWPRHALDGELWLARGQFDRLSGTVRQLEPGADAWRQLRYHLFDLPGEGGAFAQRATRLRALVREASLAQLVAVPQFRVATARALQQRLDEVLRIGGEGLMLHRADALWQSGRSGALLKLKPLHDAEAVVIGHQPGRGKHAGRLGALRVRTPDGVEFDLGTGFSDAEREAPPPLGSAVTYTFRGLTERGVPRFASFLRVRDEP